MADEQANGNAEPFVEATVVEESPAVVLARKHEAHPVTIEEVKDEDEIFHPGGSIATNSNGTATPILEDVSGKPVVKKPASTKIDINNTDAFPSLGAGRGPKPVNASTAAPSWGKTTNGGGGAAAASLKTSKARVTPSIATDGRVTEMVEIGPEQKMPTIQLAKPLNEILSDIMKEFKVSIQASTSSNGMSIFLVTGQPMDVAKAKRKINAGLMKRVRFSGNVFGVSRNED